MMRYLSITRASFMGYIMYPTSMFFTLIGNVVYITVVYYLWRQIYNGADSLHGMTFNDTFLYLTLASSIIILFKTWTDWFVSNQILQGSVIMYLIKPIDYELQMMADSLGSVLFNGLSITVPSLLLVLVVFRASIPVGLNLIIFPISVILAYFISFSFDYMIGLSSFYTESIWGISITKDVVVAALSGALVPINFFPDAIKAVLQVLPFQAIYNTPLQIITSASLTPNDYLRMLAVQLFWVVILFGASRLFYSRAVRQLTVNGG